MAQSDLREVSGKDDRIRARRLRETQNIFARLPATYAASRKQGQQILKRAAALSIVEWRTLWDLAEVGPLTIRELALIQRTDHSLLSRALPDMRRKGLVEMRRDEEDGRQTIVELSTAGREAFDQAAPFMKRRREAMRAQFTPDELALFASFLDRFDDFLSQPIDDFLNEESAE